MINAHLYNRETRQLRTLNAQEILTTMPDSLAIAASQNGDGQFHEPEHPLEMPVEMPPIMDEEADEDVLNAAPNADASSGSASVKTKTKSKETVKGAFRRTRAKCHGNELLWVDVCAPNDDDYVILSRRFGLHPLVVEDIRGREGRPKLHDYGDYLYIIFHALSYNGSETASKTQAAPPSAEAMSETDALKITEIDCLVGADYVVTVHDDPISPLQDLERRWRDNPDLMRSGATYLLYEVMDEVMDDYFPLLDAFDEHIEDLETQVFEAYSETQTADIFALKRNLVRVRRIAGPTRDVVNVLLRRDSDSGGKHFAYYQDLYDHASRIVDIIDGFRDILGGLLDAYLAMASNRMNEIMKTLTSVSVMLLVPALISGIYGMNFDDLPKEHGFYGALGAMATFVVGLFLVFKKIRWL